MVKPMNAESRDRFLTIRGNNALTAGLGLPTLILAVVALSTSTVSDRAAFIGLVILGAFY